MSIREESARWKNLCVDFFKSLKTGFKKKSNLSDALNDNNSNLILSSDSDQAVKITSSGIVVNPNKLDKDDQELLKMFLLNTAFEKEGFPFIVQDVLPQVREIQNSTAANRSLLKKLEGQIPEADLAAIRISLLIRQRSKKRLPVDDLRSDLRSKYGRRGQIICNLCGRGYLEQDIIPALKKPDFQRTYEEIIQTSGYAVFVHEEMVDIEQEIADAADKNLSYGKGFVRIYGIGPNIIQRIEDAVDNLLSPKNSAFELTSRSRKAGRIRIELKYLRS